MRYLFLVFSLACFLLSGCASMKGATAMLNGTQDQYIQSVGGKSAFETLNSHELSILCSMYGSSGKHQSFIDCAQTHIRRFADSNDSQVHFMVLAHYMNIATSQIAMGDYAAADTSVTEGLAVAEEKKLYEDSTYAGFIKATMIDLYGVRALIGYHQGDMAKKEKALARIEAELPWLAQQTEMIQERSQNMMARTYLLLGEYEKAALATAPIQREPTSFEKFQRTMDGIATFGLSELTRNHKSSFEIALEKRFDIKPYYVARAHLETGEYEKALALFKELEDYSSMTLDPALHWLYWHGYARTLIALGRTDQAIICLEKAIEVIEVQRSDFNSEMAKIGFSGSKQHVYALMINTLADAGRGEEAFDYAERAKARALIDLLAARENLAMGATFQQSQYLTQIRKTQAKAAEYGVPGEKKRSMANPALDQLRSEHPQLASLVSVQTLDCNEIRRRLGQSDRLVEFYGDDDSLTAFVLGNDHFSIHRLNARDLARDIREYRTALTQPGREWEALSQSLYNRLIQPLAPEIRGKNLIIVPHGPLHYLPFASLSNGGEFLVDQAEIRFLPSASVMAYLGRDAHASQSMLILGNPDLNNPAADLPGAEDEARAIAGLWSQGDVKLRKEATETAVKQPSDDYSLYHFACHGEFNPDRPLESLLHLAPDQNNDGRLTVGEIYGLKLNAGLVTLSACETGLGNIEKGDDVVGLTRGFLYAGADAIVASLWPVADDSTAYFMKSFYTEMKTRPRAQALRTAQLETRKQYPHPAHWAAFQLTGMAQ